MWVAQTQTNLGEKYTHVSAGDDINMKRVSGGSSRYEAHQASWHSKLRGAAARSEISQKQSLTFTAF